MAPEEDDKDESRTTPRLFKEPCVATLQIDDSLPRMPSLPSVSSVATKLARAHFACSSWNRRSWNLAGKVVVTTGRGETNGVKATLAYGWRRRGRRGG